MLSATPALRPNQVSDKPPVDPHRAESNALIDGFNQMLDRREFDVSHHGDTIKYRRIVVKLNYPDHLNRRPEEFRLAVYDQIKQAFQRAGWSEVWVTFDPDTTRVRENQMVLTLEAPLPILHLPI